MSNRIVGRNDVAIVAALQAIAQAVQNINQNVAQV